MVYGSVSESDAQRQEVAQVYYLLSLPLPRRAYKYGQLTSPERRRDTDIFYAGPEGLPPRSPRMVIDASPPPEVPRRASSLTFAEAADVAALIAAIQQERTTQNRQQQQQTGGWFISEAEAVGIAALNAAIQQEHDRRRAMDPAEAAAEAEANFNTAMRQIRLEQDRHLEFFQQDEMENENENENGDENENENANEDEIEMEDLSPPNPLPEFWRYSEDEE